MERIITSSIGSATWAAITATQSCLARIGTDPGRFTHLHHAQPFPIERSVNVRERLVYIRDHKPAA